MKLTADDLFHARDRAISYYINTPGRCRLKGMTRDLTDEERRTLAHLSACVETLVKGGTLTSDQADAIGLDTYQYTFEHDLVD